MKKIDDSLNSSSTSGGMHYCYNISLNEFRFYDIIMCLFLFLRYIELDINHNGIEDHSRQGGTSSRGSFRVRKSSLAA